MCRRDAPTNFREYSKPGARKKKHLRDARKKNREQNGCLSPGKIHSSNSRKKYRETREKKNREKRLFEARQNVDKIHRSDVRKKISSGARKILSTFRNTLFHLHRQVGMKYSSHLPAYEDGTDRAFRNVDI